MNYVCIAWGLTRFPQQKVSILQKKALRIMNFAPFNAHTAPLFKNCNILKFADIINVESFKLVSTMHSYNTRSARNGLLFVPSYNIVRLMLILSVYNEVKTKYIYNQVYSYDFNEENHTAFKTDTNRSLRGSYN